MGIIIRTIEKLTGAFGIIAGLFMVLSVVLVMVEIVMRSVFSSTIYITQEYSGYFMVAITFFGLAYTLKEKGHIRLTFLHRFVKVGIGRAILEIIVSIVGLIIFAIILKATWDLFMSSFENKSTSMQLSKTYLAIPQFAMPLGSLLICLQFIADICKQILQIKTGEYETDDNDNAALGR